MTQDDIAADDEQRAAALERGRLLFSAECRFLRGVASLDHLPDAGPVEVAVAGRSNVGKSSLLNALTGRTNLARTSNTPGRTQELNFFELAHPAVGALHMVDLPGYGYAKVSKSQVKAWTKLLKAYLQGRPTLRRALVLVDSRHGIKESDREIIALMDEAAVSYQVVLTKADKIKASELKAVLGETADELRRHAAAHPEVIVTSTVAGTGIAELRAAVAALAL